MSSGSVSTTNNSQALKQSGGNKTKPQLNESEIAAFSVSVTHHSSIVSWFAFGFVNIFAIFNAGAFSAGVAMMVTDRGRSLYLKFPYISMWTLALFALAFFLATLLMLMVFVYSIYKYRHYRLILRGRKSKDEAYNIAYLITLSVLMAVPMVASTISGICFVLHMFINYE